MSKMTVLIAGAAGYVLGARAGRERYEQIRSAAVRFWGNPTVQQKVSVLEDKATDAAKAAASLAQEKAGSAARDVVGRVRHRADSSPDTETAETTVTTVTTEDTTVILGDQRSTRTADAL
ncbi:hypothetical protein CLV92_11421 [Kineococcus xinjiangensis]|uniref:YtxH-like protein n=1 Tax=Kineococcus xinjiangensis TaxID=512762 RepID=A0A2S6IE31_9ACTN|nr:hypothetical protein [Kineococcus xinjiangensis]PPK92420.1 hypothetical protein CLV92_11421 [Kineococcus xinjiangensis]